MNLEDDMSDDYEEEWDCNEDEEDIEEYVEDDKNFILQNRSADLYSAIKEYTGLFCLPICQYLNPQKLYEFTQKYKSN
jgi:hypothetical protein